MAGEPDLRDLVVELRGTLRELEDALAPTPGDGRVGPPTPRDLARFTSEVAIPAGILVLRVNVEALRLLQRTLRMADGRSPSAGAAAPDVGDEVRRLSRATLDRLDDALADLQSAVEGRPPGDDARELLERARALRDEVDDRLEASARGDEATAGDVPVDVEAELRSIRRAVDDEDGPAGGDAGGGADRARDGSDPSDEDPANGGDPSDPGDPSGDGPGPT